LKKKRSRRQEKLDFQSQGIFFNNEKKEEEKAGFSIQGRRAHQKVIFRVGYIQL